jgi:hypothetical protein
MLFYNLPAADAFVSIKVLKQDKSNRGMLNTMGGRNIALENNMHLRL